MALMPLSIICAWRVADRAVQLPAPEFLAVGGVEYMEVAAQIAKETRRPGRPRCASERAGEAVQPRRRRFSWLLRSGRGRTGQLERLLGDGGGRGRDGSPSPASWTVGKANLMPLASKAFLILKRACRRIDEILAGQCHHLHPDLDRVIAERVDPLHLQRLEDHRLEFGLLGQFQPDLLDQLSGLSMSLS